jgi:large subunit ribosomal protein L9
MKIILLKEIEGLGKRGELIDVKAGYARNKLIPRKFALPYNKSNFRIFKEIERIENIRKNKEKKIALQKKEKIESLSLAISVQAGEDGKLFGAVTNIDIEKALLREGCEIDRKNILLKEPIKELGVYSIEISLHPEVKATLKAWIVSK